MSGEYKSGPHLESQLSLCPGGTYTSPADRACNRSVICTRYARYFAFSPPTCSVHPPNSAPPHCQFILAGEVLHALRSGKSSEDSVANDGSQCDAVGVHFHVHVINSQLEGWRQVRALVQDVRTRPPGQKLWPSLSLMRVVASLASVC